VDYQKTVKRTEQWAQRILLTAAKVMGKIIQRPSETLLTELAKKDRPGNPAHVEIPAIAASGHIQRGQNAFEAGDYAEALHCFAEAIRLAPEAPWAWHGRGDALQLSGEYDAALRAYEKACSLAADTGLHHAGRANALRAMGRDEDAETAWTVALEHDPSLEWMQQGSKKR